VLVTVLVSVMIVAAGAGALNVLDVFFVTVNLHTEARYYGVLGMAFGIGSIVGAVLGGAVANRLGLSRTYWLGLVLGGALICVYARMTNFAAGVVVLALVAVPIAGVNTVVGPIVLQVTPRAFLGRVFAAVQTTLQLCTLLSVAVAGWLASSVLRGLDRTVAGVHVGTYDVIFLAAGVLMVAGGLYAMVALTGAERAAAAGAPAPSGPADATA
jgi:MFS family permease